MVEFKKVQIKVSGERESVTQFLFIIDRIFPLSIKSKLLENKTEGGYHCFIDLDPFTIKGEDKP